MNPDAGYMAVIDPYGKVTVRNERLRRILARSCAIRASSCRARVGVLAILINGTDYAYSMNGYNIVVYDTENRVPVASVAIDAEASPVLTRFPCAWE